MAEPYLAVDIFIRQIHAAVEGNLSVDNQDFPVISVIVMGGKHRGHGGKYFRLNPHTLQPLLIVKGQGGQLAGAVVHDAHVHAGGSLPLQNLQYPAPHIAFFYNKVFQVDVVLRLFQLGQHRRKLFLSRREVGHLGIVVHGEGTGPVDVTHQVVCPVRIIFKSFQNRGILVQNVLRIRNNPLGPHGTAPVPEIDAGIIQEKCARKREYGDDHHPGQLSRGIHTAVEQAERDDEGKDHLHDLIMTDILLHPSENAEEDKQLHRHQNKEQRRAAENQPENALSRRIQQAGDCCIRRIAGIIIHRSVIGIFIYSSVIGILIHESDLSLLLVSPAMCIFPACRQGIIQTESV